jgi:phosphoribosyl-AMP cyclohydrolase
LRRWWILREPCGYLATTSFGDTAAKGSIIAAPSPLATEAAQAPFAPRFDAAGLITAVAVDARSGLLLMLAHMDAEALVRTRETGLAHFHSRSRGRLWMKGESSGNVLRVVEIRVDCDQDAIELRVEPAGPACHTGARSCFYRRLDGNTLVAIAADRSSAAAMEG